ncbi:hypothetical protein [Bifidobacterium castoris]|uniref:Uncharacterized protein n=1 Tax=Bifidobacterium castoris TaxID=2306972 RepID=A0A430FAK0_9BIFI|nr:hypothetical protein [Bifidobacterium castoris]RSX49838.1 hypothetical protein D2E22_0299 [Bifidobacterium castoris]
MEQPRKPKGAPNGAGGQYDTTAGSFRSLLPDLGDAACLDLAEITADLRGRAVREPVTARTPEETAGLLAETASVELGADGLVLRDADGATVYSEAAGGLPLDRRTLRADKRVRREARRVFAMREEDLEGVGAAERRRLARDAWALTGPYGHRRLIDRGGPLRRYAPADRVAASLRRRADGAQAVRLLCDMQEEDASQAMSIIRAGYPSETDHEAAWAYINRTSVARYDKDVTDPDGTVHHAGDAIRERRVVWLMEPGTNRYVKDADGRRIPVVRMVNKRNAKAEVARSYLRMVHSPTRGVPSVGEAREAAHALHALDDDPARQAAAFYAMAYGRRAAAERGLDVDGAQRAILSRRGGSRIVAAWDRPGGNGNVARMIAYQKALGTDAARLFLDMEPGDDRRANRVRGADGTPRRRLSEMRSFLHAVYAM